MPRARARQEVLPTVVGFPHDERVTSSSASPRRADWLAPCALLLITVLALWPGGPAPTGESALPSEYSTERAYRHLRQIAAEPHVLGSAENQRVHDYLVAQLDKLGAEVKLRRTVRDGRPTVQNIAARVRGTDSTGAVLVGAHYDSQVEAPGAGDNGVAVANALETMWALKLGEPLRNDVIFLFTDGEEMGLLGAHAFVDAHPWRDDVKLVLNFDARGNGGPMLMYETSAGAGALVRHYAEAVERPIAGSVMADIYDEMPNATDFTVFARYGYPGLNFAFIGGYQAYHRASDTVDNLDPSTATHQGASMLALVRHFGGLELPLASDEEVVYFNAVGSWLVLYSAWLVWPLTLALILLLIFTVRRGASAGRVRPRCLPGAAIVCGLGVLGSTAGAVALTWTALTAVNGSWSIVGNTESDGLFFAAITLLAVAMVCRSFVRAGRWCNVDEMVLGSAVVWTVVLLAACVWLPGGSGLLVWALVPCLLGLCHGYLISYRTPGAPRVGVYLACAAVTLAVMAPLVHLFYQAMMLSLSPVAVPLVALTVSLLWPVLYRVARPLSLIAGGLAVLLWAAGFAMA